MENELRNAYRNYFSGTYTFEVLVAEVNKIISRGTGRSYVFLWTPEIESNFYHNISKSLYKGGYK
ncbi:MAG: hypothetical protein IPM56_16100 [Ignavibacteriales bacterium]|nr:MAG: hypothetical protein IPM56_16100 [Ignavibacteriales bacterium]